MIIIGKFTEFYTDVTKKGTKIPQEQYLAEGKYPIIDQGKQQITGRWNKKDGLFEDVPAIIFGDHTRAIKYVTEPFFIGADGVKILLPKRQNDNPKYLYYALQAARIPDLGYSRHFKAVKELDIRVYPREEQDKIVGIMGKIDQLILQKQEEITFMDKLVRSRFLEMFGNEDNRMAMNEVCSIITDGTHQPPQFYVEGIPFIFVSNIIGNKVTYDTEKFIDQKTYDELIKRTPVEIGDILLSTVGSYGHPAIVELDRKFLFQRHIAYMKPRKEIVDSYYLHEAILAPEAQKQIEASVKGIAQKTLNLTCCAT